MHYFGIKHLRKSQTYYPSTLPGSYKRYEQVYYHRIFYHALFLNQISKNKSTCSDTLKHLPGNYQRHEKVYYHQIFSSCPMAHLQPQLIQLTMDTHCKLQSMLKGVLGTEYMSTNMAAKQYLAFTIASTVFFSCGLSWPRSVSTLLVTCDNPRFQGFE